MKLNNFAYLYSNPLGNHSLKIMKKIPGNLLKKTWKNHGNIMEFCQSEKVGTLGKRLVVLVAQSRVDFHVEKFLNETFKCQLHETEK